MKTIIHLSDIHFGKVNLATIEPLLHCIYQSKPDVIVISGDFTQRATKKQFMEAREFLKKLPPVEQILVPGNHDMPLFNIFVRLRDPLKKYRHFISQDIEPCYKNNEVVIVGVNTTRRSRITDGRINHRQITQIEKEFSTAAPDAVKIVVSHHPFDMPHGFPARRLVGRAPLAMKAFARAGVDVFLAGHFHKKYVGSTTARYNIENHEALVIQSGTSTSVRTRNEPPSFNCITVDAPHIIVNQYEWSQSSVSFIQKSEKKFIRQVSGWNTV